MWLLIILLWLVAPPVELAAVIGLWILNDRKKKKIQDLEAELKGYRLREQAAVQWQSEPEKTVDVGADKNDVAVMHRTESGKERRAEPLKATEEKEKGGSVYGKPERRNGSMAILALLTGIIFVVLAGLIFATTTWRILPDPAKVLIVAAFSVLFFGTSDLAGKRLGIHRTGNALYVLGSIFAFLSVLAAAYFRLLGPAYVLVGQNRWRVLWVGSLVTVILMFFGIRKFHDRVYTQVCFWGMTVSVTFWLLSREMGGNGEWLSAMMIYAWLLMVGKQMVEKRISGQKRSGEGMSGKQETGKGMPGNGASGEEISGRELPARTECYSSGELLKEGFSWFAPIHFWGFSFPVVLVGSVNGFIQAGRWLHWYLALALGAVILGVVMQLSREECEWKKTFLNVTVAGTLHYLAAWIACEIPGGQSVAGGWTILAAEMLLAVLLLAGKRPGFCLWTEEGSWIAEAFLLGDVVLLGCQLALEQMTGGLYMEEALRGNAFRALAGALILAAVLAVWRKAYVPARWGFWLLLCYVVFWPLEIWLRCECSCYLPERLGKLIFDWFDRGVLCFLMLCGMIFWERRSKEGHWRLTAALGTGMQMIYLSVETVMFPFSLLMSGFLLFEARKDGNAARKGVWLYRAAALYAMLGVSLFMSPFTRDNRVMLIMGMVWVYGIWMVMEPGFNGRIVSMSKRRGLTDAGVRTEKGEAAGESMSKGRPVFWDVCGCLLAIAMVAAFYANPSLKGWNLVFCLTVCGGFYGMFYLGSRIWPHLLVSLAWVPMPLVLACRYGWTENQENLMILFVLALSGIAARCCFRICEPDERVFGGWRVDWFQVLAVFVLAMRAAGSESAWWRFFLILVLALYFGQYAAVREWKAPAWSAAGFMLVLAYWNQPFGELPSRVQTELWLLPAAGYVWCLGKIWKGKGVQGEDTAGVEILQFAGYLLCLLILVCNAWIRGEVMNALILEGICLAVFVRSLVRRCRRWMVVSGAILILVALYMTKEFWLSISWWVYLLAAGIGLIVFAAVNEKRRSRHSDRSEHSPH